MANEIIRPTELPVRTDPVASEVTVSDNGSIVAGVSWEDGVNAAVPPASQSESEAGVINSKRMTPLTTKQAIDAQVGPKISTAIGLLNLGTMSQETAADYTPTSGLAAVALSNEYGDLDNLPTLGTAAATDAADYATAAQGALADTAVQPSNPALIPPGGSTSQVLIKSSNTDYDTEWTTSASATAVSYAPQTLTSEQRLQAQSNLSLVNFKTVQMLLADEVMSYTSEPSKVHVGPGDVIEAGGFRYEVAASDATDNHVESAGGVKLYVCKNPDGFVSVLQFGEQTGVDDTDLIQLAVDNFLKVQIPNTGLPWMVRADASGSDTSTPSMRFRAFTLRNDQTVEGEVGTEIHVIPNDRTRYSVFYGFEASNVVIRSLKLVGDRDEHLGETGEHGFGICLFSCHNWSIEKVTIRDMWGDGIYLGYSANPVNNTINTEIRLIDVDCDHNRRQGMSIRCVDGLYVDRSKFRNTIGTLPECGIDVEPENVTEYCRNMFFNDCEMSGNNRRGFSGNLKPYFTAEDENGNWHFKSCKFTHNGLTGVRLGYGDATADASVMGRRVFFTDCEISHSPENGLDISGYLATDVVYRGGSIHHIDMWGVRVRPPITSKRLRLIDVDIYECGSARQPAVSLNGSDCTIRGCRFSDNGGDGGSSGGHILCGGSDNKIIENSFRMGDRVTSRAIVFGDLSERNLTTGNDFYQGTTYSAAVQDYGTDNEISRNRQVDGSFS